MIVDDDQSSLNGLQSFLSNRGYLAVMINNAEAAVDRYRTERPAAVLLDLVMPGKMDGLESLRTLKAIDSDVPIIMLSREVRAPRVVEAMRLGAFDFVRKPFDACHLEASLSSALNQRRSSQEIARPEVQPLQTRSPEEHGDRMTEVGDLIDRVADTDVTVLIRGESGTGKELVARALCAGSLRRHKSFVKLNCAAVPHELLESELFGFERGAFTGAVQQKLGKFEFANHGTMFLDEIGDMSFPLQSKLLQVLQDGEFSRLGGTHDVQVDVRIIAATNKDLEGAIANGQFRPDLFFRLNVVCINVPPLRERREEIPVLSDYFLKKYSAQYKKPYIELSPETMRLAADYHWPGNIRELENLIKRTVVLGSEAPFRKELARGRSMAADRVRASVAEGPRNASAPSSAPGVQTTACDHQPNEDNPAVTGSQPSVAADAVAPPGSRSLKEVSRLAARSSERALISRMLQQTQWNRKRTAANLGISYKALLYKIKESGLDSRWVDDSRPQSTALAPTVTP
jgi:two-component system response regulator AtoC